MQRKDFDSEGILFEAASWVLQFENGPLSDEDRAALKEWSGRSPVHARALRDYAGAWGAVDETILSASNMELETVRSASKNSVRDTLRTFVLQRVAPVAALALLMFYMAAGFRQEAVVDPKSDYTAITYATQLGEQAQFTLADGSIVHLNTGSEVEVDYQPNRRLVRLLKGEAHFDVAKNPARPFDVMAGRKQISAVGTAFAVRLTKSGVNITVTEGVVGIATPSSFTNPAAKIDYDTREFQALLEPNEKMVIERGISKIAKVEEAFVARQLSWRTGTLRFQDDSLEYVIKEVSRYTDTQIVLADRSLKNLRVGGVFKTGEISALLTALEVSFELQAEQIDDKTIYLSVRESS